MASMQWRVIGAAIGLVTGLLGAVLGCLCFRAFRDPGGLLLGGALLGILTICPPAVLADYTYGIPASETLMGRLGIGLGLGAGFGAMLGYGSKFLGDGMGWWLFAGLFTGILFGACVEKEWGAPLIPVPKKKKRKRRHDNNDEDEQPRRHSREVE